MCQYIYIYIYIYYNSPLIVPHGLVDVLDAAGEALAAFCALLVVQRLAVHTADADLPRYGGDLVPARAELGGNLLGSGAEHLELRAEQT